MKRKLLSVVAAIVAAIMMLGICVYADSESSEGFDPQAMKSVLDFTRREIEGGESLEGGYAISDWSPAFVTEYQSPDFAEKFIKAIQLDGAMFAITYTPSSTPDSILYVLLQSYSLEGGSNYPWIAYGDGAGEDYTIIDNGDGKLTAYISCKAVIDKYTSTPHSDDPTGETMLSLDNFLNFAIGEDGGADTKAVIYGVSVVIPSSEEFSPEQIDKYANVKPLLTFTQRQVDGGESLENGYAIDSWSPGFVCEEQSPEFAKAFVSAIQAEDAMFEITYTPSSTPGSILYVLLQSYALEGGENYPWIAYGDGNEEAYAIIDNGDGKLTAYISCKAVIDKYTSTPHSVDPTGETMLSLDNFLNFCIGEDGEADTKAVIYRVRVVVPGLSEVEPSDIGLPEDTIVEETPHGEESEPEPEPAPEPDPEPENTFDTDNTPNDVPDGSKDGSLGMLFGGIAIGAIVVAVIVAIVAVLKKKKQK